MTDAGDVTFDIELGDGRIAHCWQACYVYYRDCVWSAGLVEGIEPDTLYLRVERTDGAREDPAMTVLPPQLMIALRPDELMAIARLASGALWSAELMRMDEADSPEELGEKCP